MTQFATESRSFQPGTSGWTVHDLDDPRFERLWDEGRYEIVEGVLTTMAPAYFIGGNAAFNVAFAIKTYLHAGNLPGRFAPEVDIVIDEQRVVRADTVLLLPEDELRQTAAAKLAKMKDARRARILVPPTLVIESLSPGHEAHDQITKRRWYAELGIPNYWILDAFKQTFESLILADGVYSTEIAAKGDESVSPSLFPGLTLSLREVWTA